MSEQKYSEQASEITTFLDKTARKIGRESGLVERVSKVSGSVLAQTLVWGLARKGEASLEELRQTALGLGVKVSGVGLPKRIGRATKFMAGLVSEAQRRWTQQTRQELAGLECFSAVQIMDSSTIPLPPSMAVEFAGYASAGTEAMLKCHIQYEYLSGSVRLVELSGAKINDQAWRYTAAHVTPGGLHLADLGYFGCDNFRTIAQHGGYFLSSYQFPTGLYRAEDGTRFDLVECLHRTATDTVDLPLQLSANHRLSIRLVATRLAASQATARRTKAQRTARKNKRTLSPDYLLLLGWSILVANLPASLIPPANLYPLYALRWQIELLFKLWKSHLKLASTSRFSSPRAHLLLRPLTRCPPLPIPLCSSPSLWHFPVVSH